MLVAAFIKLKNFLNSCWNFYWAELTLNHLNHISRVSD